MALPQIKPKESKESNLALMSKIHVSKNWKLPPRLPHRAGQRRKRPLPPHDEYEYEGEGEGESTGTGNEELQKKKRQNRDAQRAYRERKNNKLQALEDTIESLSKVIRNYESKLSRLQHELQDSNSENRALQSKLDALTSRQASMPAQDPILQNLIENFKPMKAIPIKYQHRNRNRNRNHHHGPNELPNSAKCGFCNDNSTCVCKELETGADKNGAALKDSSPPHSHCNKDNSSGLCSNCANIDKSCIDIQSIVH
ncbi:Yap5p [Saccharomyces eubayanus]|uniref:Yap5p n=1 Tax=Saccharomyces eubayanus TaxID=1080349 RepID=UPI0006C68CD7|nr:YAP5-like protein [Saccharomyces eubayanus]KOG98906.1 YAP5-like protein [Saccharomyces eubayanus]